MILVNLSLVFPVITKGAIKAPLFNANIHLEWRIEFFLLRLLC